MLLETLTDEILVGMYVEGKEAAFEELVKSYTAHIQFVIHLILLNRLAVEVGAQEVWVAFFKNPKRFDPKKASFKTWIHAIAVNKGIDLKRKNNRQKTTPLDSLLSEPAARFMSGINRIALFRELSLLGVQERAMVALELAGFTQAEIAETTNVSLTRLYPILIVRKVAIHGHSTEVGEFFAVTPKTLTA